MRANVEGILFDSRRALRNALEELPDNLLDERIVQEFLIDWHNRRENQTTKQTPRDCLDIALDELHRRGRGDEYFRLHAEAQRQLNELRRRQNQ